MANWTRHYGVFTLHNLGLFVLVHGGVLPRKVSAVVPDVHDRTVWFLYWKNSIFIGWLIG